MVSVYKRYQRRSDITKISLVAFTDCKECSRFRACPELAEGVQGSRVKFENAVNSKKLIAISLVTKSGLDFETRSRCFDPRARRCSGCVQTRSRDTITNTIVDGLNEAKQLNVLNDSTKKKNVLPSAALPEHPKQKTNTCTIDGSAGSRYGLLQKKRCLNFPAI